ncbi:MAG: hypothetical protein K0U98_04970 [Deltaproteobacteria bacterium]|nr:hypothetical protein [Deltaproteobacteria bacterium]
MWHLVKSEFLRFRRLAIGFAVAHLVLLKVVSGFTDLFTVSGGKIAIGLLAYGLTGLIFGLYQMGSYRRLNQWTYLIHRPLKPGLIFAALSAAASCWFFVVLSVPQLLITLYMDWMTPAWVDQRHYLLILFLLGTVLTFYLAGCFISLSPSRASILVLVLGTFFLTRQAVGVWVFVPQLIVLVWLAYLAYRSFKPDLQTYPRRPLAVAAAALPMQYAFFGILVATSAVAYQTVLVFQEEGWTGYATHAWDDHFPEGTFLHTEYLHPDKALAHGLQELDSERRRHLSKQIELARVHEVLPRFTHYPTRGQLIFSDNPGTLRDEAAHTIWTFQHDLMLFQGRDVVSGQVVGWLGSESSFPSSGLESSEEEESRKPLPFEAVPIVVGNRFLLTAQKLYEFDATRSQVNLRFQLQGREIFTAPFEREGSIVTALSDQNLYFFDPRHLDEEPGLVAPSAVVPLPGESRNLSGVQVAELIDGYLISFVFGTRSEAGYGPARQVVAELAVGGRYEPVSERLLGPGWPTLYRYRGFIASPILQAGHDLAWSAIGPHRPDRVSLQQMWQRDLPPSVGFWAILTALFSALLTAASVRSRMIGSVAGSAWVGAALLLGLPALFSFFFLTHRRAKPQVAANRSVPVALSLRTAE